jgi:hypothetical protein
MADKMNNIDIGGSVVQVPAWASEETAISILFILSAIICSPKYLLSN